VLSWILCFALNGLATAAIPHPFGWILRHMWSLDWKKCITNSTGVTLDLRHGLDEMLEKGIRVTKVFGP